MIQHCAALEHGRPNHSYNHHNMKALLDQRKSRHASGPQANRAESPLKPAIILLRDRRRCSALDHPN
jgi:hypothetical protein